MLDGLTKGGGARTARGSRSVSSETVNSFSILHPFDEAAGKWPVGTLVEVNGLLYGTTQRGGQNDAGTPSQHDEGKLFRIDLHGTAVRASRQI